MRGYVATGYMQDLAAALDDRESASRTSGRRAAADVGQFLAGGHSVDELAALPRRPSDERSRPPSTVAALLRLERLGDARGLPGSPVCVVVLL
jgi:hypothetical protein